MTFSAAVSSASSIVAAAPPFQVFGGANIMAEARETVLLREEAGSDVAAREQLLDRAFGTSRTRKSSELLRAGRVPARGMALSAEEHGVLVGTVRLWHVRAGNLDALLLGPLAVAGSHRSRGVGGMLMREAIARANDRGHRAILLVGDAPYYSRFGFSSGCTQHLEFPGYVAPGRFLGLELETGALEGARGKVLATGARAPGSKPVAHYPQLLAA